MKEIVTIQFGGFGNNAGLQFHKQLCEEHYITDGNAEKKQSPKVEDKFGIHFEEINPRNEHSQFERSTKFIKARAILVDLSPSPIDLITTSSLGKLFSDSSIVQGTTSSGNNFAKGYVEYGPQISSLILDAIRFQLEKCDRFQGFQMFHSLSGGTGSGLASLLSEEIEDLYHPPITNHFTLLPESRSSYTLLEYYNATLALSHLKHLSNRMINCMDNSAIASLLFEKRQVDNFKGYDLHNDLIARLATSMTCCQRFPSEYSSQSDLLKMATNLIPFYYYTFLIPGLGPLYRQESKQFVNLEAGADLIYDTIRGMYSSSHPNTMLTAPTYLSKTLSQISICRGSIYNNLESVYEPSKRYKAPWVSTFSQSQPFICNSTEYPNIETSVSVFMNSFSIGHKFRVIHETFNEQYKRKAHLHYFTEAGLGEEEIQEASSYVTDLCNNYALYNGVCESEEE